MESWYTSIYKALIFGSVISFIVCFFSSGITSYNSSISGYSILILGIMMILTILITKILGVPTNSSTMQLLLVIVTSLGPFLLMLGVIGFMLYLIIYYKEPILENKVSASYTTFSSITTLLLLLQLYVIYTNITTSEFETSGKLSSVTSGLLYLLSILSLASTLTIYIILKYFRTDGFQVKKNNEKNNQFSYLL